MRKIIRFMSFAVVLCIAFSLIACGSQTSGGGDKDTDEQPIVADDYENAAVHTEPAYHGVHEINYSESDIPLVKNGATEYAILYPADCSNNITFAVNELAYFFAEATGIEIPAISDDNYDQSGKYISVGDTAALRKAGVTHDINELSANGYLIKTIGNDLYLIGGGDNGTINAVYGFLKYEFSYAIYATDEVVIDTGVKNRNLYRFDVKDIPDIAWRVASSGEIAADTLWSRRMGINFESDFLTSIGGRYVHNFSTAVKPSEHTDHPEWFAVGGTNPAGEPQLCLTRDMEGLGDYVFSLMVQQFTEVPDAYAIGFTQMDDGGWCSCDQCLACSKKYGSNSAAQILFMNYVARKLKAWRDETFPGRQIYIFMFAYHATEGAPDAILNADGTYSPKYPELQFEDCLLLQIAPIYAAAYHSFGDDEYNFATNDNIKKWGAYASNFMFWSYSYYYKDRESVVAPYFDFSDFRDTHRYLANIGVIYLFDEDSVGARYFTDWNRLKTYLRSKVTWDTECDLEGLKDEWFKNYFKDASDTMLKLFDEYCTYYTMLINENRLRGQGGILDIRNPDYWPKPLLDSWMGYFEQAYKDIEYLKEEDPELYTKLFDRICLETLTYRWLSEDLYGSCSYVGDGRSFTEDRTRFNAITRG